MLSIVKLKIPFIHKGVGFTNRFTITFAHADVDQYICGFHKDLHYLYSLYASLTQWNLNLSIFTSWFCIQGKIEQHTIPSLTHKDEKYLDMTFYFNYKLKKNFCWTFWKSSFRLIRTHTASKWTFTQKKRNSSFKHSPRNYMPSESQNMFQINLRRLSEQEITILRFSLSSESAIAQYFNLKNWVQKYF